MLVMKNGRLVKVKALKSDLIKKPTKVEEVVKPEEVVTEDDISDLEPSQFDGMEKKDLIALCEEKGIEFPKKAKVADLIDLLEAEVDSEEI